MIDMGWLSAALKVAAWRAAAVATACAILFFLRPFEIPEEWIWVIGLVGLVSASITAFSLIEALWLMATRFDRWFWAFIETKRKQRTVLRDLDTLSQEEREIFGYLLAHNQRSFSGAIDGGYANTLIAKGLIAYGGGTATDQDCAFVVPAFVWKALLRRKEQFPKPSTDVHPWRRPWYL
jgi:hypothetical protein